ncbi:MAG: hypothetical protein C7B47_16445 [Sulfobacillus thermosulfidooxidans]|uniref:Chlorite dismutase n=1 Tax=Sulfobacillus thermosulfidooxidans TaxID=28034 RepID=A0A2T2WKA4_SULTH|nr:MAG: hypothetical protein C7B47_16445 [Sulfobacillus thermosulfidooxidans]
MKFFVKALEPEFSDSREVAAMRDIRRASLDYLARLEDTRLVDLVFKSSDWKSTILVAETDSLEELDRLIKRDPLFPYVRYNVKPVTFTREMVDELEDYLGETVLTEAEKAALTPRPLRIKPDGQMYYLVEKDLHPFSPLMSEEEIRDVYRATLVSQRLHASTKEVVDYNPVGIPHGYLIMEAGSESEVFEHLSSVPIFKYTTVTVTRLLTMNQAYRTLSDEPPATIRAVV